MICVSSGSVVHEYNLGKLVQGSQSMDDVFDQRLSSDIENDGAVL